MLLPGSQAPSARHHFLKIMAMSLIHLTNSHPPRLSSFPLLPDSLSRFPSNFVSTVDIVFFFSLSLALGSLSSTFYSLLASIISSIILNLFVSLIPQPILTTHSYSTSRSSKSFLSTGHILSLHFISLLR